MPVRYLEIVFKITETEKQTNSPPITRFKVHNLQGSQENPREDLGIYDQVLSSGICDL